jgi:hypothetical protein
LAQAAEPNVRLRVLTFARTPSSRSALGEDKMRKFAIMALAGGLSAYGLAATAQDVDADIDTDGDGMYSMDELSTVHTDMTEETFTTLDEDGDGIVSPGEYQTGMDAGTITKNG